MKIAVGVSADLSALNSDGFIPSFYSIKSALSLKSSVKVFAPKGGDVKLRADTFETEKNPENQYQNTIYLAEDFSRKVNDKNYDRIVVFSKMGMFIKQKFVLITTTIPIKRALIILEKEYPATRQFKKIINYYRIVGSKESENYKKAGKIVTFSAEIKKSLIKELNITPGKIVYIPRPVPYFIEKRRTVKNNESGMKIILMPSELRVRKGIRYAIETMKILKKKLPGAVLIICGKVNFLEKEYVRKLLKDAKGKANVVAAGFLPKDQLYRYMEEADCAFMPFCFDECPIALGECVGHGLPVITNKYAGYEKKVIESFGYCLEHNAKKYAEKLIEILSDEKIMDKKRRGAIKMAKNFTFPSFAKLLNETIRKSC